MLGDNARIDNVRKRIIAELNAAKLPIYVLEYIVGEIYTDLQKQRVAQVKKEQEEFLKKTEEKQPSEVSTFVRDAVIPPEFERSSSA